jgi:branched-chain amino acid transport system ATP-binding protein
MDLLEVKAATKVFGGLVALNQVTFSVKEKSIISLIGPNGAGKTTLLNTITGLEKLNKGEIYFNKNNITNIHSHLIAQKGLTRTFQIVRVCKNMTVLENVIMGLLLKMSKGVSHSFFRTNAACLEEKWARDSALEVLKLVNLEQKAFHIVGSLPYGEQRLVEVARAVVSEPLMILLDEPAAGLNFEETNGLGKLIQEFKSRGITVLLIDHQMSFIMDVSDRIVVLNFGELIAEGTPEEIKKNPVVIEAYLGKEEKRVIS